MGIAPNIVWLAPLTNMTTKARLRDLDESGFWIAELVLIDTPRGWPQSGFQLVAAWLRKGHADGWPVTRLAGSLIKYRADLADESACRDLLVEVVYGGNTIEKLLGRAIEAASPTNEGKAK